jgi:predicted RNA-binding protein with TRAM domain
MGSLGFVVSLFVKDKGGYKHYLSDYGEYDDAGKEYEVAVEETSRQGQGIARVQGFDISIPNAGLGDHVKVKVNRIGQFSADAEIVK